METFGQVNLNIFFREAKNFRQTYFIVTSERKYVANTLKVLLTKFTSLILEYRKVLTVKIVEFNNKLVDHIIFAVNI